VAAQEGVVYHRIPWGSQDAPREPRFWLEAQGGSTEPGAEVLAYDTSDLRSAREIGRTTADAEGAFRVELTRSDRPVVYVAAADRAGNVGPVQDVKEVRWVATLGGKVAGSVWPNPHRHELRRFFQRRLVQADAEESIDVGRLAGRGETGDGAIALSTVSHWRLRDPVSLPQTAHFAAAYDEWRARVVLFGGEVSGDASASTWEWDLTTWKRCTPRDPEDDGNPGPRRHHAMAYDPLRARVVMFGGSQPGHFRPTGDTWEWDGASWSRRAQGQDGPSPRDGHAMAMDRDAGVVVLFGGRAGTPDGNAVTVGDTWAWDGSDWNLAAPTDPSGVTCPPARYDHGMAHDRQNHQTVLLGGSSSYGSRVPGDTWLLQRQGSNWVWTRRAAAPGGPGALDGHAMAYDGTTTTVLLTGGARPGGGYNDTTWSWNGSAWTALTPTDPGLDGNPSGRNGHALLEVTGLTPLVGGYADGVGYLGDTWEWYGAHWVARRDLTPTPGISSALAFDASRNRAVFVKENFDSTGETWEWPGRSWASRSSTQSPAAGGFLVYDAGLQKVLRHDGEDHLWRLESTGWVTVTVTGSAPDCSRGCAVSYDKGHAMVVVYQAAAGATWTWDGAWSFRSGVASPPARRGAATAYDDERQRTVLFGGCSPEEPYVCHGETWEWDGVAGRAWSRITPTDDDGDGNPTGRSQHVMAYDARCKRVVLFGGSAGGRAFGDTWTWDGASWTQPVLGDAAGDGSPGPRYAATMTYQDHRRRLLLVGGWDGLAGAGMTWELDPEEFARPGQASLFTLQSLGWEDGDSPRMLTFRAVAGGRKQQGADNTDGVTLWTWSRGTLMAAVTRGHPATSPGDVTWSSVDPVQIRSLSQGPRQDLVFALTSAPRGQGESTVVVDYVELELRYRRP
jgi:hypothetical protein